MLAIYSVSTKSIENIQNIWIGLGKGLALFLIKGAKVFAVGNALLSFMGHGIYIVIS